MFKTTMLAAGLVALAFAALPALASATNPNPQLLDEKGNPVSNLPFEIDTDEEGISPHLEDDGTNPPVDCAGVVGEGEFETSETGWIELEFTECHTIFSLPCGTSEASTKTIETGKLPFHLKTVDHGEKQTPGVLITPEPGKTSSHDEPLFADFVCSFVGTVEVGGNGIVGTITTPDKGELSEVATLKFQQTDGVQTHRTVTNDNEETVEYDLSASIGGGETTTAGQEADSTLTFPEKVELETTEG